MIMTNRPHRLRGPLGIGSTSVGAPPGSVPCRAACVARDKSPLSRSFSCGRLVSFVQRICAVDAEADGAVERRQQRGFLLTQSRNGGAGPRILCSAESITCASFWATTSPFPFSFYPRGAWLRVRCHLRCFFVLATNQRTAVYGRGEALPAWSPVGMWLGERDCCPCPARRMVPPRHPGGCRDSGWVAVSR
jgi:hypothetical protein